MAQKISSKLKKMKIAFTGPESCGKTTMARWTAKHISYELIPEYAREYLQKTTAYHLNDLNNIALEQFKRNSALGDLVVDTEMLVMKIWCEEKYSNCSQEILDLLKEQKIDHYFLCKPDIPWEPDPLRENPEDRERLFKLYERDLLGLGVSYNVLSGNIEERKMRIIATLKNLNVL